MNVYALHKMPVAVIALVVVVVVIEIGRAVDHRRLFHKRQVVPLSEDSCSGAW